jgi:hypothetical protein
VKASGQTASRAPGGDPQLKRKLKKLKKETVLNIFIDLTGFTS